MSIQFFGDYFHLTFVEGFTDFLVCFQSLVFGGLGEPLLVPDAFIGLAEGGFVGTVGSLLLGQFGALLGLFEFVLRTPQHFV